jgi:hypothetical protein
VVLLGTSACFAEQCLQIKIGYLHETPSKNRISLIDIPAPNDGVAGARMSIEDNNTTGQFINQEYALVDIQINDDEDSVSAVNAWRIRE